MGRGGSPPIVGYAAVWNVLGAKYRFDVVVNPQSVRRGIGSGLFDIALDEARRSGARTLQARAYEASAPALAFLARRDFVETMKMRWFTLDLAAADMTRIRDAMNAGGDVTIGEATPGQMSQPEFWSALADLHNAARDGWPDPDPGGPVVSIRPDTVRSWLMPGGEALVALVVAARAGQWVGSCALVRDRLGADAHFAATAVRPDARGRGLATALRARALVAAREAGYTTVRSASGSAAIAAINARFGFGERFCEVRLVRRLSEEPALQGVG